MNRGLTKEEKFDSIYRAYADDIFKLCYYFTRDREMAQDLAQQTFIKFYDRFEDIDPEYMQAYLMRMARNLFYNYQRGTKKEVKTDEAVVEIQQERLVSESLEEEYFRRRYRKMQAEFSGTILEKLRKENESWYKILNMLYLDEKTHDEISEELGITKDVLYSRIHRVKRWVRKHYKKEFDELINMA